MKYLILLAALLLACGPATAQTPRGATPPDSLTSPLAAAPAGPDTVAAIHRLFAARRKRSEPFILGAAGVVLTGGVMMGTARSDLRQSVGGFSTGLIGLIIMTHGLATALDYNKKSEQQAVEDFQAHKVPRYLKRRLKPKYFQ